MDRVAVPSIQPTVDRVVVRSIQPTVDRGVAAAPRVYLSFHDRKHQWLFMAYCRDNTCFFMKQHMFLPKLRKNHSVHFFSCVMIGNNNGYLWHTAEITHVFLRNNTCFYRSFAKITMYIPSLVLKK